LRNPLRFEGFDAPATGTPPLLGADTDTVLTEELGFTAADVAQMRMERVL
jgi:crotonobetainyl-CoA:carnitine CoA-transferase CaiB-like acyl-CoA transferase